MRRPNLVRYIETARAKGKSDKDIIHELLDSGWHMDVIKHAMGEKPAVQRHQKVSPPQSRFSTNKKIVATISVLLLLMLAAAFA